MAPQLHCLRTGLHAKHPSIQSPPAVRCFAAASTTSAPTQRKRVLSQVLYSGDSSTCVLKGLLGLPEIYTPEQDGVIIVGAGIGGLASAAALHKVGVPAVVLERSQVLREEGAAIGMWTNAFRALDAIGVAEPCRAAHPLNTRLRILRDNGAKLREFGMDECHGGPHEIRPVFRSGLLKALEGGVPAENIHFGVKVADVESTEDGASVMLEDGRKLRARAVIGADGVRSVVGRALNIPPPTYAGYIAYRGVARFDNGLPVPAQTISMVFGSGGRRAGMIPLDDRHVYWFTTTNRPASDPPLKDPAACKADALEVVRGWRWGVADTIRQTEEAGISRARITDRWMAPGRPVGAGALSLVGDALHPCTPNLGQGGCLALEDAVVLARALRGVRGGDAGGSLRSATATAVSEALRGYERERSGRALRIAAQSWLFGFVLQMPLPPVVAARDFYVKNLLMPAHFLSHTTFNVGTL